MSNKYLEYKDSFEVPSPAASLQHTSSTSEKSNEELHDEIKSLENQIVEAQMMLAGLVHEQKELREVAKLMENIVTTTKDVLDRACKIIAAVERMMPKEQSQ